jgi:uncharacterized protein YjbI with pentapeptide repeats
MDKSFRKFLDTYIDIWRSSSITQLTGLISKNYKAREITNGEIVDFGFEESITGWEQGFNFVKENNAEWELKVISVIPIRIDERLVIISATMVLQGKSLNTINIFFQTFKKESTEDWVLIRSYIETGVSKENIKMEFNFGENVLDKNNKIYDVGLGFELENRQGEEIHEATLKNSMWDGVDFRDSSLLHVNFEGSKLQHINFSNVKVDWIQIGGTTFGNIVRPKIDADGDSFKNSDLTNAVFEGCNLQDVNINNSNIEGLKINGILVSDLLEKYNLKLQ